MAARCGLLMVTAALLMRPSGSFILSSRVPRHRLATCTAATTHQLDDGRRYTIFPDDAALAEHIVSTVAHAARTNIEEKGGFSISIGSGTTVKPLARLKEHEPSIDFSKVHVFFGNERTSGDAAGKCLNGAQAWLDACGVPPSNVHSPPFGDDPAASAEQYTELLLGMPENVVGRTIRGGKVMGNGMVTGGTDMPVLDLVLLGSGADGHTASLYPGSKQVLASYEGVNVVVPADKKGGVTFTIDTISSAARVLLSAGKAEQSEMVAMGLREGGTKMGLPAGMICGEQVEWLLTEASAVALPGK